MAKRRTSPKRKCMGKAYWKAVSVKQGRARGSKASLINSCSRCRGASKEECTDLVTAGLKGRRKSRPSGKPYKRRSTALQRSLRKEFGRKSRACKRKVSTTRAGSRRRAFLNCMSK